MLPDSLEGGFADPAIGAAHAFRAALTALSNPGTVQTAQPVHPPAPMGQAAGALLLTLCDPDTPIWLGPSCATDPLRAWIAFHTGAPLTERAHAAFAFGTWADMLPLEDFAIGSPEYPDRSATLVVEVPDLGTQHGLTGPGIATETRLTVPDPDALRANAALFPLGLDLFLTCNDRFAGLPRTTRIGG